MYFKKKQGEENQPLLNQKEETKERQNESAFFDGEAGMDKAIEAFIRIAYLQFQKQVKSTQHGTN